MLAKMKPKKYGDRQFLEQNTNSPDVVETLERAMEEAQRKRAEMLKKLQ